MLTAYSRTVERFVYYVLLRCALYTNNRDRIKKIAVRIFIDAYMFGDKNIDQCRFAEIIDNLIEQIAHQMNETRAIDVNSELLLQSRQHRSLATALNMLESFDRQVIVLGHINMMSTKAIATMYTKTISHIRLNITTTERQLACHLNGLMPDEPQAQADEICIAMSDITEILDADQTRSCVMETVMKFLIQAQRLAIEYKGIRAGCPVGTETDKHMDNLFKKIITNH